MVILVTKLVMIRAVVCVLVVMVTIDTVSGMTRAQLKKTLSIPKRQCMTKFGVNEAKVGDIENGNFIEDPKVMCYITCIYQAIQVIKNNRVNKELVLKQIDILYPQEMKAAAKDSVSQCFDVQFKYEDMCEGVFWSVKCMYETDPSNFVFP